MLNVDAFLVQRYPRFVSQHGKIARSLSRFLSLLFHTSRFEQFASDHPHLEGYDFVEAALRYFDFSLRVRTTERVRIPSTGRVVIAANHPIGSLDGLALLQLVREVRGDVKVVANDMLTTLDVLKPVLLPVNNMGGNTPRKNLRELKAHLEADGAVIIFPAGEVSRLGPKGIKDGSWQPGFIKIAKATKAPILPVFIGGRNSLIFYGISFIAKPLSTLWLVREMFKQCHSSVDARVGNAVPYEVYSQFNAGTRHLAALFRKHVYRLARAKAGIFQSIETVAAPENRILLKAEIEQCEQLGETPDGKAIYLYKHQSSDCLMREIGRLRELTFRSVGEGSGLPRDIDRFDLLYSQILLWDPEQLEIAGAYRLGDAVSLRHRANMDGLYTQTLFEFGAGMDSVLAQGLELGRSFVQPRYQGRHSLDYLWHGIGAFLKRHPQYRYLFGPVSLSTLYGDAAIARIVYYYSHYYGNESLDVVGQQPFQLRPDQQRALEEEFSGQCLDEDFKVLRRYLSERGLPVPILYKHYVDLVAAEGVSFAAFNVDPEFENCVDGFIVVDLNKLKPRKKKRYLGVDVDVDVDVGMGVEEKLNECTEL